MNSNTKNKLQIYVSERGADIGVDVSYPEFAEPRMQPPEAAAEILKKMGYNVGARLIRQWADAGEVPAVWSGRRRLINVPGVIRFLETGQKPPIPPAEHTVMGMPRIKE